MPQKVYLSNYELKDAIKLFFSKLGNLNTKRENIKTWDALGRVTTEPIYAKISSPHYNSSAMDGIAALSARTYGASENNHILLEEGKDFVVVDTGDPIPKEFDCVIMVEDLIKADEKRVKIYKSAVPWQNIRPIGEDIVETQLIVPSNHEIRSVDIGSIIAGGINEIEVYKKPLAGIIATGTEIVEPGTVLKEGDIIDFNSYVFATQVVEWGGVPKRYGIIKDFYEDIKAVISKAAEECDIIMINAGSSAGREDFTSRIIEELGEMFVHGIAIKPGKPVILGRIRNKPVIGIPGYPVSAYFVMESIVKKLIYAFSGREVPPPKTVKAVLSRRVMSSLKYLEFIRVKLGFIENKFTATPLTRGAGATMSLVNADGVLEVSQNLEGIEAGSEVEIKLLRDEAEIKNTIVSIGSHDPIMDILGDKLHRINKELYLSSAHVGSMGGIMALRSYETHIAPIHLLDTETGEYNISYIKKYLQGRKMALIKCVNRIQGFVVKKGNPLGIKGFKDLAETKVRFVNRQRGSGTRLLMDFNLKKLNISPSDIRGYEREEFTHLAVAAAVAAGDADTGLAVFSASAAFGLDFIPIGNEEYDFAVPLEYLESDMLKELINTLKSNEFQRELDRIGGYDYKKIGTVILI